MHESKLEYVTSWVLLISLRSTDGWTSRIFIMLLINKASLALYIACTIVKGLARETAAERATSWPTWSSEGILCYWVRLWLKHWNLSLSRLRVCLRLHPGFFMISRAGIVDVYAFYWRPFTTCIITLCSLILGRWSRVHNIMQPAVIFLSVRVYMLTVSNFVVSEFGWFAGAFSSCHGRGLG